MSDTAELVAKLLLDIQAITLNSKKPFTYASGILSPVYTDCRILISYPNKRQIIRDLYIEAISETKEQFEVIAGTATAGIPHAAWIADKLELPMIYVRKKPKDHGKGNQIEGILKNGQKVAVIEDLVSTGESSAETVRAIRNVGGICSHIFAIITYGMNKSQEVFAANDITLTFLTDFATVVTVAEQEGYIKKEEQAVIMDWVSDPSGWGKRAHGQT